MMKVNKDKFEPRLLRELMINYIDERLRYPDVSTVNAALEVIVRIAAINLMQIKINKIWKMITAMMRFPQAAKSRSADG